MPALDNLGYTWKMEKKQVVIVGAGVSGLAAASLLSTNGNFDVTLLEAENHIGGRVHSLDYYGEKIELGAQWIHGRGGNAIYEVWCGFLTPQRISVLSHCLAVRRP